MAELNISTGIARLLDDMKDGASCAVSLVPAERNIIGGMPVFAVLVASREEPFIPQPGIRVVACGMTVAGLRRFRDAITAELAIIAPEGPS